MMWECARIIMNKMKALQYSSCIFIFDRIEKWKFVLNKHDVK